MGNEAIAYGALYAGVGVVTGYPGTPSTEVLETIAKQKRIHNLQDLYVEWSINEKSAMEVAAGASYAGMRTLVTMKQVGLNVASDALMSLEYVGVEGGMVILVADDPGPISSQTEQDTRRFAAFSKVPVFDPSTPEEAFEMVAEAYELSETYHTPVFLRPTTRICHANAVIDLPEVPFHVKPAKGFVKDSERWVIFPKLSYQNHLKIEERNDRLTEILSDYNKNIIVNCDAPSKKAIAASGVSAAYAREGLELIGAAPRFLKIATPFPFPELLAKQFLEGLDEVLVYEELDPVIEQNLALVCHKYDLNVKIRGKLTGDVVRAGENSTEAAAEVFAAYLGLKPPVKGESPKIPLPVRPPGLCAGCPHRASFYAVKKAMEGRRAVFAGDIGCYTLGNAKPLDMTDTCLCMGAGITVAQGIKRAEPDTVCFSFTGDSTFYHTGLAGIANAVYNQTQMVAVILDNSTTAMTGHQPNPNTGRRADGEVAQVIDIEGVLKGLGVEDVQVVNPLNQQAARAAVLHAADVKGVSAIIFRAPCIALFKPKDRLVVNKENCIGCKVCIMELGCPAIVKDGEKVKIDQNLCHGCGLCQDVCLTGAIGQKGELL
ncbi:MAG: indolepyruvate ferredoxin oxidoreductase subunit alpha [Firmicutes bacterium]|nr:indolepyruvate ferredoxin oxidoreductase subunit alpha [Bacillota bacterium]